ncbi:MAG: AAA family ATPase [Candidatus Woesearchaeota archaeon]
MTQKTYVIDTALLKRFISESKNTYKSLFQLLGRQSRNSGIELSDLVDNYSELFAGIARGVEKLALHDPFIKDNPNAENLLTAYSMHIASRVVVEDLESMVGESALDMNIDDTVDIDPNAVFSWEKTSYSNTKLALESMANYAIKSSKKPAEALKDFFDSYSIIISKQLQSRMISASYTGLSNQRWKVGSYEIKCIKELPNAVSSTNPSDVEKQGYGRFHTPLKELVIPKNEIIPKSRIVGDKAVLDFLEKMVEMLFCYNPRAGMNPYLDDEDMFTSAIMLEGMPGVGKGVACYSTISYALKLNSALNSDLLVTEFVVDSSWVDGSILKLKSQFDQINSENRLYLIFQDEIQRLIKSTKGGGSTSHNEDVELELQKFLNGTYANKGNYLLLATTNKFNSLRPAVRDRFHLESWRGAYTAEEKATLFRYKLEKGIQRGYVEVSDRELKRLGQLAYESELSGRIITRICKTAKQNNYDYQGISSVLELRNGRYEDQIKAKNRLFGKITFEILETETLRAIDNLRSGEQNTLRYEAG